MPSPRSIAVRGACCTPAQTPLHWLLAIPVTAGLKGDMRLQALPRACHEKTRHTTRPVWADPARGFQCTTHERGSIPGFNSRAGQARALSKPPLPFQVSRKRLVRPNDPGRLRNSPTGKRPHAQALRGRTRYVTAGISTACRMQSEPERQDRRAIYRSAPAAGVNRRHTKRERSSIG